MPFRTADAPSSPFVPDDPFARFVELYDALEEGRGFFEDKVSLRFAAVTLLTTADAPRDLAARLRDHDAALKARLGWMTNVSPSIRVLIAALLVKYGDTPESFLDEVERARATMRQMGLRRGGAYEFLAVLVLRRLRRHAELTDEDLARFAALYEEMKRHHWWLTGPEDFPACAMLVGCPGTPEAIGESIEAIYQSLRRDAGLAAGDALQTTANVLFLSGLRPPEVTQRFVELRDAFKAKGQRIWQREYDEVATLCFLARPVTAIVESVLAYRDQLQARLRWLPKSMAFGLGTGLAFVHLLGRDADVGLLADAKALLDMQAVVAARQAAAVAAASA